MTTTTRKYSKKPQQKAPAGPPSCSGVREVELNLQEQFQQELCCHECGNRFVIEKSRKDDSNRVFAQIPPHKISVELHELRKRLEREAHG